ncbi:MAG TPA: hypothetical protein VG796_22415 [Verrucomicrobiales bacterium]|nr:hypothetical protein [Verrucomicrobiales bacterium]
MSSVSIAAPGQFFDEVRLPFPHQVDGTGAVIDPVPASPTYGHAIFSATADKAANYVLYRLRVPGDLVSSMEIYACFTFRLGGADTGKHAYKLSMANVGGGAGADAPAFTNEIPLSFAGDPAGAAGDLEVIPSTVLTGWSAALTPGNIAVVKLARDGDDGTLDTSSIQSSDVELTLLIPRSRSAAVPS